MAVNLLFFLKKPTGIIGVKLSRDFNLSLVSEVFYSSVRQHTFFKFTKSWLVRKSGGLSSQDRIAMNVPAEWKQDEVN